MYKTLKREFDSAIAELNSKTLGKSEVSKQYYSISAEFVKRTNEARRDMCISWTECNTLSQYFSSSAELSCWIKREEQ